jgi:hypothetical protein
MAQMLAKIWYCGTVQPLHQRFVASLTSILICIPSAFSIGCSLVCQFIEHVSRLVNYGGLTTERFLMVVHLYYTF